MVLCNIATEPQVVFSFLDTKKEGLEAHEGEM